MFIILISIALHRIALEFPSSGILIPFDNVAHFLTLLLFFSVFVEKSMKRYLMGKMNVR